VLAAGVDVLEALGFHGRERFNLRLNHRGILRGLMQVAGVPETLEDSALVAIDKLDKIGMEGVRKELNAAALRLKRRKIADDHGRRTHRQWGAPCLAWRPVGRDGTGQRGRRRTERGHCFSAGGPAAAYIRVDPYLARGLSYYTGPIFEIEFPGFSGSGGGGGRYDNLVGMFLGQTIPACGFSLGLDRILLLMEEQNLFPHGWPVNPRCW